MADFQEEIQDPYLIMRADGVLDDAAAGELRALVADAIERSHIRILLDCTNLVGISEDGQRALLLATLSCRRGGGAFVLCDLTPALHAELLESAFYSLLEIEGTCAELAAGGRRSLA